MCVVVGLPSSSIDWPPQLKQTALLVAFTLGEDCFRFNTQPLIDTVRGLRTRYHQVSRDSIGICLSGHQAD